MVNQEIEKKKQDIKRQIEDLDFRWYVLSVVSGQESIVVENLKERIKKQKLEDDIVDFLSPVVDEVYYKASKKTVKQKKLYPGYVFVKSKMNDKIWYVIRNTPGVRLIIGAETRPVPLTEQEYQNIMKHVQDKAERAEFSVPYKEGDVVSINEGDFKGMKGVVTEVDPNKGVLFVNIEILGRSTPIMVAFEKIDSLS